MKLNYFNFKELNGKMLLTNDFGSYIFMNKVDFRRLISRKLDPTSAVGQSLMEAGFIYDDTQLHFSERNEVKVRNMKNHLSSATSLHIFVVTTACNLNCVYCQANNGTSIPNCFMSEEIADKSVDIALQSPETHLSFEFQGGEPLLNFPVIKHIVEYAERRETNHIIDYSMVTNLTLLTDEIVDFLSKYNFSVSTSIDGPSEVHNSNRCYSDGSGSYDEVIGKIDKVKSAGLSIGAIETTTRANLPYAKELIRTYADLGFESIFIRHLTQLGKAKQKWSSIGYDAEEFLGFYREAIEEIFNENKDGRRMQEQHAAILIKRIKGEPLNYMELRSPCGAGIGQLAYFADGRVFTCDEGRMLAEMGNDAFLLGNVWDDTYSSIIMSGSCRGTCQASTLETIPSCCDCVYQPYCGTCPVVSFALNDDIIEKQPRSFRCKIYSGMLDYIFELLEKDNRETIDILDGWSA